MNSAPKRRAARPGLSYYDANRNRLITIEDDVLGIKKEIEDRWGLRVFFDEWADVWVVVQTDYDGTESFVCQSDRLDRSLIQLIHDADQHRSDYDAIRTVDSWNDAIERERQRRFEDQLGDFSERFVHALKKDGYYNHGYISNTANTGIRAVNR